MSTQYLRGLTEQVKIRASINKGNGVSQEQYLELPKNGMAADEVKARLQSRVRLDFTPSLLFTTRWCTRLHCAIVGEPNLNVPNSFPITPSLESSKGRVHVQ